jgi:acyl carrier protein
MGGVRLGTGAVSASDPIECSILTALASMAAVDRPFTRDALLADVDIDSLDLVELTQVLEDECELSVPADAFAAVVSVGDVIDVVRSHIT